RICAGSTIGKPASPSSPPLPDRIPGARLGPEVAPLRQVVTFDPAEDPLDVGEPSGLMHRAAPDALMEGAVGSSSLIAGRHQLHFSHGIVPGVIRDNGRLVLPSRCSNKRIRRRELYASAFELVAP